MYFTHSSARQVFSFDYSITNSSISNQRLFYEHAGTGEPDGLRVDVNGNIWQAIYGEGRGKPIKAQSWNACMLTPIP